MGAPASSSTVAGSRPTGTGVVRMLGRYQLLRLLGKSARSMLWLGQDTQAESEVLVALPREPAADADALGAWRARVQRSARLKHPRLLGPIDVGDHDRWPFAVYERGAFVTWPERIGAQGLPAQELAEWGMQVLEGLAYAHEAGAAHRDLQPHFLVVDEGGNCRLLGLEVVDPGAEVFAGAESEQPQAAMDERTRQRAAAEGDLLAFGLILHQALAGTPPLDEPDVGRVVARLPPQGHEIVRLPWSVPRPVPDPLRAIVNRSTDRQPRQRYRNARTFERALEGWLQANGDQDAGPVALLLGRLRSVGLLPASRGGADRAARLALLESSHTHEMAELVLQDFALAFELLRAVNLAQEQAGNAANGPVLAIHRAIAMVGMDGVRRAALSLRAWPGPLNDEAANALEALVRRVRRAGEIARALQPAGYDPEVVMLVTAFQNLGWLVVQYHFPDEAAQIRRLMQPEAPAQPGQPVEPGMSAEAASFAVLGIDVEALGTAVVRHWGLDDSVQAMVRRAPRSGAIHPPASDTELLRLVASCANEVIEAAALPARLAPVALQRIAQRYGRALNLTLKDLQEALATRADQSMQPTETTHA